MVIRLSSSCQCWAQALKLDIYCQMSRPDGFVKVHLRVAPHLSSLQRTSLYASFLKIRAPCIWGFSLRRLPWRLFTKSSRPESAYR